MWVGRDCCGDDSRLTQKCFFLSPTHLEKINPRRSFAIAALRSTPDQLTRLLISKPYSKQTPIHIKSNKSPQTHLCNVMKNLFQEISKIFAEALRNKSAKYGFVCCFGTNVHKETWFYVSLIGINRPERSETHAKFCLQLVKGTSVNHFDHNRLTT